VKRVTELLEPWFCFSLVWTVGATCDNDSRVKFDRWMRDTMQTARVTISCSGGGGGGSNRAMQATNVSHTA